MSYSISNLTNPAQCDGMLQLLANRKTVLENRITNLTFDLNQGEQVTASLPAQLNAVEGELTGALAAYDAISDGPLKMKYQAEVNRLENAKIRLLQRQIAFGAEARLSDELELEEISRSVAAVDELIALVQARRTEVD